MKNGTAKSDRTMNLKWILCTPFLLTLESYTFEQRKKVSFTSKRETLVVLRHLRTW